MPARSGAEKPEITFVLAAHTAEQFPDLGAPEVAFVGRSNVGKSSLINAFAGGRSVARTSRTPGRTRSVNFYRAAGLVLVDLPGYGYAQVSKEERQRWQSVVETYLRRSALKLIVLILDARLGPTDTDRTMWQWLQAKGRRSLVVATKMDKLGRNAARSVAADVARQLGVEPTQVRAVSATQGEGVRDVWKAIVSGAGDVAASVPSVRA